MITGGSEQKIVLIDDAYKGAVSRALRLYALSSAAFPQIWQERAIELFKNDIVEFALYARRLLELAKIRYQLRAMPRVGYLVERGDLERTIPLIANFWDCLNMILHAQRINIVFAEARDVRGASPNVIFGRWVEVHIETDKKVLRAIDVMSCATFFLGDVVNTTLRMMGGGEESESGNRSIML